MRFFLVCMGAVLALILLATEFASAQARCGLRPQVLAGFEAKYGETVAFQGLSPPFIFEVLMNPETGSWTVIRTDPNGVTCMLVGGDAGQIAIPEKGDPT